MGDVMQSTTIADAVARPHWLALLLLPLVLALAVLTGWLGGQPPAVRSGEAAGQFSTSRASALVANIARAPHVSGSAEHARVRDVLVATLRGMGLETEIQRSFGVRQFSKFGNAISVAPVENVVAVLPGRDRSQPGVAVMAHYDSVAFAPGAGDDAAGTAAVVETARLLRAGPQPVRDVYFVITDAEELGLIGAHVFFNESPLAKRVGTVVNVEARGSRGLATMFQTSPGNAALVDLWARNAIAPSGNSLTSAIYRLLPNDTDLTVALAAGKVGINAAFIDGQFDYHSPTDSPANLDKRTLQQLGDFAVTTTRALAVAEVLPPRGGDAAYFDVFGIGVVRYPVWFGWGLLALSAVGLVTLPVTKLSTTWPVVVAGTIRMILVTALAGGVCHLIATLIHPAGTIAMRERLAEAPAALWMYLAVCLAALMAARVRGGLWIGSIALLIVVAAAAQAYLPGANWLFVWPVLAALAIAHVAARSGQASPATLATTAIAGGFVLALLAQLVIAAYVGLGSMTPLVVALIVPFAVALTGPLLALWGDAGWSRKAAGAALVASAGATAWFGATDGFSARHPRPGDLFHVSDDAGKSWWATSSSRAELPPGKAEQLTIPAATRFKLWATPAPKTDIPGPQFAFTSDNGAMRLQVTTAQAGRMLLMSVRPSVAISGATLNGKPVDLAAGKWTPIALRAAVPADLMVAGKAGGPGTLEVRYLAAVDGLPAGVTPPGGAPTNWTPLSGSRATMGTARFAIR
jgi:Peptidase family M28